jgi:uncharacterized protein
MHRSLPKVRSGRHSGHRRGLVTTALVAVVCGGVVAGSAAVASPAGSGPSTVAAVTAASPVAEPIGPVSVYVRMADGVRIAVDVWLPSKRVSGQRLGTAMRSTRYWRGSDQRGASTPDPVAAQAKLFNDAGLVLVVVDARGSGASFGSRPGEFFDREIRDYGEVADWIARQSWSNGRVGTFGVSYDGDTAERIARLGNKHITAIAPQFTDYDVYEDVAYPGGLYNAGFVGPWGVLNQALDGVPGAVCRYARSIAQPCATVRAGLGRPRPVDGPDGDRLRAAAVRGHAGNVDAGVAAAAPFKDDVFGSSGESWQDLSAGSARRGVCATQVPILIQGGWLDAGTANGTLSRFVSFCNSQEVYLGNWSHGGGFDTDPFRPAGAAVSPSPQAQAGQVLDFFARHVTGDEPVTATKTLRYATAGEPGFRTTRSWPPVGIRDSRWYLASGTRLQSKRSAAAGADVYRVDRTATTGTSTRWDTPTGGGDVVYPDRRREDRKLLAYTSAPLTKDLRVTGRGRVDLTISSSTTDGAVIAYLEDVAPDGRVTYLTEGHLRLSQRAIADRQLPELAGRTPRGYLRADARPMPVGTPTQVRFDLLPTSVVLRAGHRLRVAIAGHDQGHFAPVPANATPTYTIHHNPTHPSALTLPMDSTD